MEALDDLDKLIGLSEGCFSLNETHQGAFLRALKQAWKENEFGTFPSSGGVAYARNRIDKIVKRDPTAQYAEMIVIRKDRDDMLRLVMTRRDFHSILRVIMRRSGWTGEVHKVEQIPSGLADSISKMKIDPKNIFPNLKDDFDSMGNMGPYSALCGPRFTYGMRRSGSLMIETDEDDCDYASSKSESDGESLSGGVGEEHEMVEATSEVEIFLKQDEEVTLKRIFDNATLRYQEDKILGVHPYQLSCAIFTLCARYETTGWHARRMYSYVRDYLCDQVRLSGTDDGCAKKLSQDILAHLSGEREYEELRASIVAFEGVSSLVRKHRRIFVDDKLMMKRGRLESFERISDKDLEGTFHAHHSPSNGRTHPSIFHCPCGMIDCSPTILRFNRARVSPFQLHTSLCICEKKFRRTDDHPWNIAFSADHVILIADEKFIGEILQDHVPYLLNRDRWIHRTVLVPTYYVHLHSYFYGSNLSLCTAMEFLLRSFSWMRFSKSAYMPKDLNDPVIGSYRLLHLILDKFGSESMISTCLIDPLSDLIHKKRKASALKEDVPTLYSSIRAFVLVYAPHSITKKTVFELYSKFTKDDSHAIRTRHRLAWKLIKCLMNKAETSDDDDIMIPERLLNFRETDDVQKPQDVFDHPAHLLLYYLCASGDLSPTESVQLFLSIGSYTRISGQMKVARYCSSISMRKPSKRGSAARAHGGMLAYELLKAKEKIKPCTGDIKFAHGITHLFRCLEDLEYGHQETLVPMTPEQILADPKSPPSMILDLRDEDSPRAGYCLPLWKSLIYDQSYRTNDILYSSENSGRSMVYTGEMEMRPFWGCHTDMLESIVLQPITCVQALPYTLSDPDLRITTNIPLDLRDTGSPCPSFPDGSPLTQRIERLSEIFHASYEDRRGWTYPPSMMHVLSQTLSRH